MDLACFLDTTFSLAQVHINMGMVQKVQVFSISIRMKCRPKEEKNSWSQFVEYGIIVALKNLSNDRNPKVSKKNYIMEEKQSV